MKAAQIDGYEKDIVINNVEIPVAGKNDVVVKVYASSLNPFDTTIRTGTMKDAFPLQFPVTLGGDIAGEVTGVGELVTNVVVGDKVFGQANVVAGNSGAFAEFARTKSIQVAKSPQNLDYTLIASLPLVGVSALQALTTHIQLTAGQKLFIHGGAGGIGTIAIQIAKHIGAYVAVTASPENTSAVTQLGADQVIDYTSQDFTDILSDYDAVFDTVGGKDFNRSFQILKKGGVAVTMIAELDEALAKEKEITAIRQVTKVNTTALDELCALVEADVVSAHVGKVYKLDQIMDAFTARETGKVQGKIVIDIKNSN